MPVTDPKMRSISVARNAAFETLEAVATGAYASDSLLHFTRSLESRDAGLASQIVFGCLRYQSQLDFLISRYARRPAEALDPSVRIALRAGIFQLRYLDRIPAHAAVHESVEFGKRRKRAAAGLVNAVLRKINRDPVEWPDLATELSCPGWLLDRWVTHFGEEAAAGIARAALNEPFAYIRVASGADLPPHIDAEPTAVPGCWRIKSPSNALSPSTRLHDIGSQAIVPLLDLRPGDSYLDLCAAPGNKTMQSLEVAVSPAIACDISLKRLREVRPVCPRVVLDATRPLPFSRRFDRIFIDAPCSGTGTIGRNPEIKWRVKVEDFRRFGEKQSRILNQALKHLAPGGNLVYATCSLEPEENEDVVARVLAGSPGFLCRKQIWRLPGRDEGDGFFAAVISPENPCD